MRRMLESKARQKVMSEVYISFEKDGGLFIYAYVLSNKLVRERIAIVDVSNYQFDFIKFAHSESVENYLRDICSDAQADKLLPYIFRHYVVTALTDFLSLYGQRF